MGASVLVCGAVFDGVSEELADRTEILVVDGAIAEIGGSVQRPDDAELIDLSERTACPGFIDTHVHLTMDASRLAAQTLESSAAKALQRLNLAREYLHYGFTTLRDLGSMDPEFPTVAPAQRARRRARASFYAPRWDLPVSAVADGVGEIRRLVRREHAYGSDWIKTANAGGYFSVGDDPARPTWFDDEMEALCDTARLLAMPVAVHTGAAEACKQAIRYGARSLEHAYLIDEEASIWRRAAAPSSSRRCR